jgi:hypothetical protein
MSDTIPPGTDPFTTARLVVDPIVREIRKQTELTREIVGVLRDLKDELAFARTAAERLLRMEQRLESLHLAHVAATGG